jgi:D-arabinan exo alpha-(1,3)/(1,5)-arabinofuranosidase (non-reducing end)
MKARLTMFIGLGLFFCAVVSAGKVMPTDISNIWEPQDFTAARVSSTDPTGGNGDRIRIRPWETVTFAEMDGPGMIHHIWFTISHRDPMHLRNMVLRIYWDDETTPSVEAPVGDFFGLGHGDVYDVDCVPFQTASYKGLNCFFPMPFKKKARLTMENQSEQACGAFYFYVDYRKDIKLPKKINYFHAWYNQAFPADQVKDYVLMEAEGKGHYVGCNMSIHLNTGGWWGEGDDHIYIDGDAEATLTGTGSEDYFCGAWCYREAFNRDYLGAPQVMGADRHKKGSKWNVYRYHILDPIPFKKDIKVHIETGRSPGTNARNPISNNHSSVAYWYQIEPHKAFPPLPKAKDRISKVLEVTTDAKSPVKEGEKMPIRKKSGGKMTIAGQGKLPAYKGSWSGRAHMWYQFTGAGQWADAEFLVDKAGTYNLSAVMTRAKDYAIAEISINGVVVKSDIDCYVGGTTVDQGKVSLGTVKLKKGANIVRVKAKGKNNMSSGYFLGLDQITLK